MRPSSVRFGGYRLADGGHFEHMMVVALYSVISRNIYSTCKLFGLSSGDFLNNKVLVGDERLFTVTVTEKERMYADFARELIRLRDGYLSLSNGFVMP